jgi:hypothetical protein
MAKKAVTYWFIEPGNDFTNKVIADRLSSQNQADEGQQAVVMLDNQGRSHSVWQADYRLIKELFDSAQSIGLQFQVFNRRGSYGMIRLWKFGGNKKKPPRLPVKKPV